MRSLMTLTTAVLIAAVTGTSAQAPANLSGEWRADPAPAAQGAGAGRGRAARGDMGSGWGPLLSITQDDAQVVIEDRVFSRYDIQPQVRLTYRLDGTETGNSVMIGHSAQRRLSRATWRDRTLEITTQYPGTHPGTGRPLTTEVVQRLRLEGPDVLIVETMRRVPGAEAAPTRAVYTRQSPQK